MWKMIAAGLGVLALLAVALVILNNKKMEYDTGVRVFVDKEPTEIVRVQVENGFGSYQVYYDEAEDGYVFDDLPVNIIDVDGFFELMNHASGFGALRMVKENAQDLAAYGLDEPQAVVDVVYTDGKHFALAIGTQEKVSGNYYCLASQALRQEAVGNSGESLLYDVQGRPVSRDIYIFSQEDVLYFLLKKEAYISYQVTPELAVSSPLSAVRDITFSGTALETPVTITTTSGADPDTVLAAKSFGTATHIIRMKGVYELDQTYGIEVLGSVLGIRALDVAGYHVTREQLKEWGFDNPYLQVDFSLKNGTDYIADYQLQLVPLGEYYLAYMQGSGVVFVVEPPAFVSMDPTKLCMRWFLTPLRKDVAELKVEFDEETYILTSGTDEDGEIYATVNGEIVDRNLFFAFYRLVTSAASDGIYLENPVNEEEPVMTITYTYNIEGKAPDVMRLYEGSLRRVNVDINGVTEFDMKASFVTAMKNACHNIAAGEVIEEAW